MSKYHYDMVYEIDASSGDLRDKDIRFIEDMLKWSKDNRDLSEGQKKYIASLWQQCCG